MERSSEHFGKVVHKKLEYQIRIEAHNNGIEIKMPEMLKSFIQFSAVL